MRLLPAQVALDRIQASLDHLADDVGCHEVHAPGTLREGLSDALQAHPEVGGEADDELLVLGSADDRAGHYAALRKARASAVIENVAEAAEGVNRGDLGHLEGLLTAQAVALNAMFVDLARRAHVTERLDYEEHYVKLAFKAQSQCRW